MLEGEKSVGPLRCTQPGGLLRTADAAHQQLLYLGSGITCSMLTLIIVHNKNAYQPRVEQCGERVLRYWILPTL